MAAVPRRPPSEDRSCSIDTGFACIGILWRSEPERLVHSQQQITSVWQCCLSIVCYFRVGTARLAASSHEQYELPTFQARRAHKAGRHLRSAFRACTRWCLRELHGVRAAAGANVRRARPGRIMLSLVTMTSNGERQPGATEYASEGLTSMAAQRRPGLRGSGAPSR